MGASVGFDDLAVYNPSLAHGLEQMLQYDFDDFELLFDRTFTATKDGQTCDLKDALLMSPHSVWIGCGRRALSGRSCSTTDSRKPITIC